MRSQVAFAGELPLVAIAALMCVATLLVLLRLAMFAVRFTEARLCDQRTATSLSAWLRCGAWHCLGRKKTRDVRVLGDVRLDSVARITTIAEMLYQMHYERRDNMDTTSTGAGFGAVSGLADALTKPHESQ